MDYYSLFWGPRVISMIDEPGVRLRVGHQHPQFWPILARYMDYYSLFWGPGVISTITELCCQHSQFLPILSRFVDYFVPFWGSEAISIVLEPQGAFMCPSSTLTVLANSDLFRGLLLAVLGSRNDFHIC